MKKFKKLSITIIVLLIISSVINSSITKAQQFNIKTYDILNLLNNNSSRLSMMLTPEEKEYIANSSVIKAATIGGAAPLAFVNKNGEIEGIFQSVLNEISKMTGLTFECDIYQKPEELLQSDAAIIYGISSEYATEDIALSKPFLRTQTVLYLNSSTNLNQMKDPIYAAVKGSELPKGINERNVIYYDTREDSLNAVEKGEAHYSYGNAFSVSYYTLLNGYQNIVTVPIAKDIREYCIGVLGQDHILLSITNKALNLIDKHQMNNIILNIATNINRKVTLSLIMDNYGTIISLSVTLIILIMLYIIVKYVRLSRKLREQNRKYEELSQRLLKKVQLDDLTGLYNAGTTKNMIIDRLSNKKNNEIDAMILMDCDRFKDINDTQGHLTGNYVLEKIAICLKKTFSNPDIIGRMGGDEFCVYMKDILAEELVVEKCNQLNSRIRKAISGENVSVSVGIYIVKNNETYEEAFIRADEALYEAKHKGKSLVIIWDEDDVKLSFNTY